MAIIKSDGDRLGRTKAQGDRAVGIHFGRSRRSDGYIEALPLRGVGCEYVAPTNSAAAVSARLFMKAGCGHQIQNPVNNRTLRASRL